MYKALSELFLKSLMVAKTDSIRQEKTKRKLKEREKEREREREGEGERQDRKRVSVLVRKVSKKSLKLGNKPPHVRLFDWRKMDGS